MISICILTPFHIEYSQCQKSHRFKLLYKQTSKQREVPHEKIGSVIKFLTSTYLRTAECLIQIKYDLTSTCFSLAWQIVLTSDEAYLPRQLQTFLENNLISMQD